MGICVLCKIPYRKGCNFTLHRFPHDPSMRSRWLAKLKIHKWTPNTRLCSKHFEDKCFYKHPDIRTTLKKTSIPTIFEGDLKDPPNEGLKTANSDTWTEIKVEMAEQPLILTYPNKCDEVANNSPMPFKICRESEDPLSLSEAHATVRHDMSEIKIEEEELPPAFTYQEKCGEIANKSPANSGELEVRAITKPSTENNLANSNPKLGNTDELEKEYNAVRLDHTYKAPPSPNRPEIGSILHDHQYENTPKSLARISERLKRDLKKSQARVKCLSLQVKRLKAKLDLYKYKLTVNKNQKIYA